MSFDNFTSTCKGGNTNTRLKPTGPGPLQGQVKRCKPAVRLAHINGLASTQLNLEGDVLQGEWFMSLQQFAEHAGGSEAQGDPVQQADAGHMCTSIHC